MWSLYRDEEKCLEIIQHIATTKPSFWNQPDRLPLPGGICVLFLMRFNYLSLPKGVARSCGSRGGKVSQCILLNISLVYSWHRFDIQLWHDVGILPSRTVLRVPVGDLLRSHRALPLPLSLFPFLFLYGEICSGLALPFGFAKIAVCTATIKAAPELP